MEPAVEEWGLSVPVTGITDFKIITAKMAELFITLGREIKYALEVRTSERKSSRSRDRTG